MTGSGVRIGRAQASGVEGWEFDSLSNQSNDLGTLLYMKQKASFALDVIPNYPLNNTKSLSYGILAEFVAIGMHFKNIYCLTSNA